MHRSRYDFVIPVLFPKQDCNAWCANSKLRSKKNATHFEKNIERCGLDVAHMPLEFSLQSAHDRDFFARIAFQRSKNRAMKQRNDEFSTVCALSQGNQRSGAINCGTDSRARIKCISVPLTMTSSARGRVL